LFKQKIKSPIVLPACEDGTVLRSFVLTQYWHVTETNAIANMVHSIVAHCIQTQYITIHNTQYTVHYFMSLHITS